jgi:hypothetical protein
VHKHPRLNIRQIPKLPPGRSLILVLIALATMTPGTGPAVSDAYLARQAAALQPAYRADLERLTDAPRYLIEASIDPERGSVTGQMRLRYSNTTGKTLTYALLTNLEEQAARELLVHWNRTTGPRGPEDAPVNSSSLAFSSWGPYHAAAYTRGALFLDELRQTLEDEAFSP